MKLIVVVILALFTPILSNSNFKEEQLIGTWKDCDIDSSEGVLSRTITFNNNHTFDDITLLDSSRSKETIVLYGGDFKLYKDSIYLNYPEPWGTEVYYIEELTDTTLRYSGIEGTNNFKFLK